jgi:hypothetical protein
MSDQSELVNESTNLSTYLTQSEFEALDLGLLSPEAQREAIDLYENGVRVLAERRAAWVAEHRGEVLFGHVVGGDNVPLEQEVADQADDDDVDDELEDDDFAGGCEWGDYADDPIAPETFAELAERLQRAKELRWLFGRR